jgi:sortase B
MRKFLIFGSIILSICLLYQVNALAKKKAVIDEVKRNSEAMRKIGYKESTKEILGRYKGYIDINKEVVGWIKIPYTKVDYPIVKTDNNNFYLNHNIKGEENKAGWIFMDYRNEYNGTDKNIIIYGHHMKDGSMFRDLVGFKDAEFFNNNKVIQLYDMYGETEWEVFSAYVTKYDFPYLITQFENSREYLSFIKKLKDKSNIKSNVQISEKDKILTLSTCTYEYKDARLVVHAKKR